ncbi:MAG TPA: DegT/DnrJ/EryC1/StrS family aminotransferase [Solirubrobacteraceae bacterium]
MSWTIPLTDVVFDEQDVEAVAECLESGWLTMGPRTQRLEAAVAAWTGSPHAIAVSSGTAALHLACAAINLEPGDEVLVPAFTFVATANAPRYRGATPVLCDVASPAAPNLDPADLEHRITPRTRAVIAVHMCGYPADITAIKAVCDAHGLALIEDAAQAIGAELTPGVQAGTAGELGCVSFFSKKQLGVGEGGMVLTADGELAERVKRLRSHAMTSGTWDRHRGHEDSYDVVDVGFNFRLDEPRAALALSRLPHLAADIARRRAAVRAYRARLAGLPGLTPMWDDAAVEAGSHFAFTVLFDSPERRAASRAALAERGIQTTRYPALHTLSEYAPFAPIGSLPRAEAAAERHLALPLSAHTTEAQVEQVCAALAAAA